jgi:hypothetical protein
MDVKTARVFLIITDNAECDYMPALVPWMAA